MEEMYLELKKEIDKYINEHYIEYNNTLGECYIKECMNLSSKSLDDKLTHINDTFQESVFYHIDSKGLDEVKVYRDAHLDRKLFSKLRSNRNFKPSKKTAICLCLGLKLNLDETNDLLEKAGYTLSHSSKRDLIIEYFITIGEYNIDILNEVLYEYEEEILYV